MSSHGCTAVGTVTASELGHVAIELAAPPRCEGCNGACLWYRAAAAERLELAADHTLPVGSTVAVTLPDGVVVLGAVLAYGVPLAAVLAGGVLGSVLGGSDLAAAGGASAALAIAWLGGRVVRARLERATLRRLSVRLVE